MKDETKPHSFARAKLCATNSVEVLPLRSGLVVEGSGADSVMNDWM